MSREAVARNTDCTALVTPEEREGIMTAFAPSPIAALPATGASGVKVSMMTRRRG